MAPALLDFGRYTAHGVGNLILPGVVFGTIGRVVETVAPAASRAISIGFRTQHALPHWEGSGIPQADIEAQIESELRAQLGTSPAPTVEGPFMGRTSRLLKNS